MQRFSNHFQFDEEVQATWEKDIQALRALQTAPSADLNFFWPVTASDFTHWRRHPGSVYNGPPPLRPRPSTAIRTQPLPNVTQTQSDMIRAVLVVDKELMDMEYFHRALRLCGGRREYEVNRHLGIDDPRGGNLVIMRTAADREASAAMYTAEEVADLLGDWERDFIVGYVSNKKVSDDVLDPRVPTLLVKVCQPWLVDAETGQPTKPVWAARRDAGGNFKTSWEDVRNLPWLPVTELPENTLERYYSPDDEPGVNYTARMKDTRFGYPVANKAAIRAFATPKGVKEAECVYQLVARELCDYTLQVPTEERAEGALLPPDCMRRMDLMDKKRRLLTKLGLTVKRWQELNPRQATAKSIIDDDIL